MNLKQIVNSFRNLKRKKRQEKRPERKKYMS